MNKALKKAAATAVLAMLGVAFIIMAIGITTSIKGKDSETALAKAVNEEETENTDMLIEELTADRAGINPELLAEADQESTTEQETTEPETSSYENKFIANITESLNIRKEPNGEVIGKLSVGDGGDVIEKGAEWTKITSGSVTGYVSTAYIKIGDEAEALALQVCKKYAIIQYDSLRVRQGAGTDYQTWGVTGKGHKYLITAIQEGWYKIDFDGLEGYICSDYATIDVKIGSAISKEEEEAAAKAAAEKAAAEKAAAEKAAADAKAALAKAAANSKLAETIQTSAYNMSEEDAYLIACVVFTEAGYDTHEDRLAVANIILNRLNGGGYGSTIRDVLYAKNQFSVVNTAYFAKVVANGPNADSIQATKEALSGKNNVPNYTNFCSAKSANYSKFAEYSIIGGNVFYRK